MDESTRDERMRHLQRIAYGAVASDTERAAALVELESLRRDQATETDAPATTTGVDVALPPSAAPEASASEASGSEASASAASASEAHAERAGTDPARPLRWAIVAGTTALLLGVGVGWQLDANVPSVAPELRAPGSAPDVSLDVGAMLTGPVVTESLAYDVFDRPATPADSPALDLPEEWVRSADLRLLVTMPDGAAVYAAKSDGSTMDMCVVIVVPGQPGLALSCTRYGIFEGGRLSHEFWLDSARAVSATLFADGSVQVGGRPVTLPVGIPGS